MFISKFFLVNTPQLSWNSNFRKLFNRHSWRFHAYFCPHFQIYEILYFPVTSSVKYCFHACSQINYAIMLVEFKYFNFCSHEIAYTCTFNHHSIVKTVQKKKLFCAPLSRPLPIFISQTRLRPNFPALISETLAFCASVIVDFKHVHGAFLDCNPILPILSHTPLAPIMYLQVPRVWSMEVQLPIAFN